MDSRMAESRLIQLHGFEGAIPRWTRTEVCSMESKQGRFDGVEQWLFHGFELGPGQWIRSKARSNRSWFMLDGVEARYSSWIRSKAMFHGLEAPFLHGFEVEKFVGFEPEATSDRFDPWHLLMDSNYGNNERFRANTC